MINLNKNMPSVFLVLATDHQSGKPRNRENYNKLQEKIQRQYAHLNLNYKQPKYLYYLHSISKF